MKRDTLTAGEARRVALEAPGFARARPEGQIFETHVRNDLQYGGGRLPGRQGLGSGWSGAKIGWTKNSPVERFINRMAAVIKGSLGGAALSEFDAARSAFNRDQPQ